MSVDSIELASPIAVGRFMHGDTSVFLPFSAAEVERARSAMLRLLRTFHFRSGQNVLFCSVLDDAAQVIPLERACMSYGLVVLSADSHFFDASRVESILRRFEVAATFGVTAATLDGLEALGIDPRAVFAKTLVWASPAAYERLRGMPGLRRWLEVGPALGLECSAGQGLHICRFEWKVEEEDGEIVLSSRLSRAMPFARYRSAIHARLETGVCACGNADPRLIL
jgi:hypothetical protein